MKRGRVLRSGVVMLISLCVITNASVIASDWINFKKSRVLKRSVVSPRSNLEITLSSYWRTLSLCSPLMLLMSAICEQASFRNERRGMFTGLVSHELFTVSAWTYSSSEFSNYQDATTVGVLFVMVMAGLECQQRLGILGGSWLRLVAYISPILLVVQVDWPSNRSSHQSGLSLRWQGLPHCRKLPTRAVCAK